MTQDCQHLLSGSCGATDPSLAGAGQGRWIALLTPALTTEVLNGSAWPHLVSKSCQNTPKNGAIFKIPISGVSRF